MVLPNISNDTGSSVVSTEAGGLAIRAMISQKLSFGGAIIVYASPPLDPTEYKERVSVASSLYQLFPDRSLGKVIARCSGRGTLRKSKAMWQRGKILQKYDFIREYRPKLRHANLEANSQVHTINASVLTINEADEQANDPHLSRIHSCLKGIGPKPLVPEMQTSSADEKALWRDQNELQPVNGVLYINKKTGSKDAEMVIKFSLV